MCKVKFEYGINKSNEKVVSARVYNVKQPHRESLFFNGKDIGSICTELGLISFELPEDVLDFIKNEKWILFVDADYWSLWTGYMSATITPDGSMTKKMGSQRKMLNKEITC